MTTVEKAQRYDEALERYKAKQEYESQKVHEFIEYLFPELKESEDEKIRKNCIHFLKLQKQHHAATFEIEECISWLKKQGKQKPAEYTLEQAAGIFLDALSNSPYNNKPITDAQVITKELLKFLADTNSYNPNAVNEPKPANWSEEDEKKINYLIALLQNSTMHNSVLRMANEGIENWLKSLKDRVGCEANCTTTKEWSKEDERLFQIVIDILDRENHLGNISHTDLIACVRKLKSLRPQIKVTDEELAQAKKDAYNDVLDKIEYDSENPTFDDGWSAAIWYLKKKNVQPQNTWKPSDEQLTWLYRAADDAIKDSRMKQVLNELLSDLNKLREE